MKTEKAQLFFSIIIFIAVFGLFYFIKPNYLHKPRGIVLPVTKFKEPIDPNSVIQIPTYPMPKNIIAYINAEYYAPNLTNAAQMETYNYIKQLAANIGASEIMIVFSGYSTELATYEIQAQAIG